MTAALHSKASAIVRLLAGGAIALFVAMPLATGSVALAVDAARGWRPPPGDPTLVPTLAAIVVLLPLSVFGAWKLIASGRRRLPQQPSGVPRGFWAGVAERHPQIFARAFSLNGFGLRYLDFHERVDADDTWVATLWITAAFLPVAPVRCERVRVAGRERTRGVPFVATATQAPVEPLERLAMRDSRNRRVYLFYYAVFLPLVVAPVVGGLALVIARGSQLSALAFWAVAFAILAWGVGVVAAERRVMGRPSAT